MPAAFRDSALLKGTALGNQYLRENKTEAYVCIPPALIITDSDGSTWTLGFQFIEKWIPGTWSDHREMYFTILRNDVATGIFGNKIEYLQGKVRVWTPEGKRTWVNNPPHHMAAAPGYWI